MSKVLVYTDGASRNNPGRAGIGVRVLDESGVCLRQISRYIGHATNNVAEYTALVIGLQEALKLGAQSVECFCDSELVVKQMRGEYKIKDNTLRIFSIIAANVIEKFSNFKITHVMREKNKEADLLANQGIDSAV